MKNVTCVDKDGNQFEVPVLDLQMRPSVYGVIISDGKVLLVRQWDGYDFPGGGIDLGETIEEALVREVKEESGMDVVVGEIIACENSFFKTNKGEYLHSVLLYYTCEVVGGELSIDGIDEAEKAYVRDLPEWVPLEKLDTIKFYNSVDSVEVIQKAVEKSS
jgi:8-oxo-dGTP diphosphatase